MLFHNFVLRKVNWSNVHFYAPWKIKNISIFGEEIFKDPFIFIVAFEISVEYVLCLTQVLYFIIFPLFQRVNWRERA